MTVFIILYLAPFLPYWLVQPPNTSVLVCATSAQLLMCTSKCMSYYGNVHQAAKLSLLAIAIVDIQIKTNYLSDSEISEMSTIFLTVFVLTYFISEARSGPLENFGKLSVC